MDNTTFQKRAIRELATQLHDAMVNENSGAHQEITSVTLRFHPSDRLTATIVTKTELHLD